MIFCLYILYAQPWRLLMVILFMPQRQPLLHELFAAFRVRADAHWVAGRRSILGGIERK